MAERRPLEDAGDLYPKPSSIDRTNSFFSKDTAPLLLRKGQLALAPGGSLPSLNHPTNTEYVLIS